MVMAAVVVVVLTERECVFANFARAFSPLYGAVCVAPARLPGESTPSVVVRVGRGGGRTSAIFTPPFDSILHSSVTSFTSPVQT